MSRTDWSTVRCNGQYRIVVEHLGIRRTATISIVSSIQSVYSIEDMMYIHDSLLLYCASSAMDTLELGAREAIISVARGECIGRL